MKPIVDLTHAEGRGNRFILMGLTIQAAQAAGWHPLAIETLADLMLQAQNYDHLMEIVSQHFEVK